MHKAQLASVPIVLPAFDVPGTFLLLFQALTRKKLAKLTGVCFGHLHHVVEKSFLTRFSARESAPSIIPLTPISFPVKRHRMA